LSYITVTQMYGHITHTIPTQCTQGDVVRHDSWQMWGLLRQETVFITSTISAFHSISKWWVLISYRNFIWEWPGTLSYLLTILWNSSIQSHLLQKHHPGIFVSKLKIMPNDFTFAYSLRNCCDVHFRSRS
jgi:hypothetical protein